MNVVGYPQPGKMKSTEILEAFCAGAGGRIVFTSHLYELVPDAAAAFYGTLELERLIRQARRRAENGAGDFFYIDNAYFDCARQRFFRVSRNALQRPLDYPDRKRLGSLGVQVKPWRSSGRHVLIVEQSDYFMRELAGWEGGLEAWRNQVIKAIDNVTDRPMVVRRWLRDKTKAASSLAEDLAGAWALVTHASAAAVEALLAGIPVFATGQTAAGAFANRDLAQIEAPVMPDDSREEWAARLAASQWTLNEMRAGITWRALTEEAAQ